MENKKDNGEPWQEFGSDEKMAYLLNSGHLSDCCFIVGQGNNVKEFRCHKFLLIMASSVFESMFCGSFIEATSSDPIAITDAEPEHFYYFLKFIYDARQHTLRYQSVQELYESFANYLPDQDQGSSDILNDFKKYDIKTLGNLIYLAKKYLIPNLQSVCHEALVDKVISMRKVANKNKLDENVKEKDVEDFEIVLNLFELAVVNEYSCLITTCVRYIDELGGISNCPDIFYCMDASMLIELIKSILSTPVNILLDFLKNYIEIHNLNNDISNSVTENCIENLDEINNEVKGKEMLAVVEENDELRVAGKPIEVNYEDTDDENEIKWEESHSVIDSDSDDEYEWEECVSEMDSDSNNEISNSIKELNKARATQINSEIIQKLYEAINFTNLTPSEFCKLANSPELVKYLSDHRKFEILQSLCQYEI